MKQARILFASALISAAIVAGCRPAAPWSRAHVGVGPAATATREVQSQRWSFRVPDGWAARVGARGDRAVAQAPSRGRSRPVRVTLAVEPFRGPSAMLADRHLGRDTGVTVIGEREAHAGTLPATDVEAIFSGSDPAQRSVQRYTTDAGMGFVLTCSAPEPVFAEARPVCALVLGSFRLHP